MTPRTDPALPDVTVRPALAVVSLLVFVWPLVRNPPLSLLDAWLHLFGFWGLLILALFALSRGGRRRGRDRNGQDRGA